MNILWANPYSSGCTFRVILLLEGELCPNLKSFGASGFFFHYCHVRWKTAHSTPQTFLHTQTVCSSKLLLSWRLALQWWHSWNMASNTFLSVAETQKEQQPWANNNTSWKPFRHQHQPAPLRGNDCIVSDHSFTINMNTVWAGRGIQNKNGHAAWTSIPLICVLFIKTVWVWAARAAQTKQTVCWKAHGKLLTFHDRW